LLLDLKLPDVSGLEILERIKREKQDLKIIVISGSPLAAKTDGAPQIDQKDICRLAQFTNAVISKPFTPDEIISTIQSLTKPTDMFR
jgi:CheY-like chemotaxis protein